MFKFKRTGRPAEGFALSRRNKTILRLLDEGPLTSTEIAAKLGLRVITIDIELSYLAGLDLVEFVGNT